MTTRCKDQDACPSKALTGEEIKRFAMSVDANWHYEQAPDTMTREFKFASYKAGVDFAVKLAQIAEELNHHPDIYIGYKTVRVTYWTHNANGLTHMDFAAASKIDELQP